MRLKLLVLAVVAAIAPRAHAQALEARHLPGKLAGYIEEVAQLERSSGQPTAPRAHTLAAKLDAAAAAFDERYRAYQKRRAEVDAAVAKAQELEQQHSLDQARAAATAVITPTVFRADQSLEKRDTLEVRDAELPAIEALYRIAVAQGDLVAAIDVGRELVSRRKVGSDLDDEKLLYIASVQAPMLDSLAGGHRQEVYTYVQDAENRAQKVIHEGEALAVGHVDNLGSIGIHRTPSLSFHDAAKPGEFLLFKLDAKRVRDGKADLSMHESWQVPYDCKDTNHIESIDPHTGAVHYRQACKYRTEKRDTSAKITLADALPASASEVMVLAKVEHAGGKWVLTGGRIVDLGYLSKLQTPWF